MNYCKNCGHEVRHDDKYCSNCGQSLIHNPYKQSDQRYFDKNGPLKSKYEQTSYVLGITALIFSALNWIGFPYVHLIGLVLGFIGLYYVKKDKLTGSYSKVGNIMSIIAIVLAIASMVIGGIIASRLI
ncbi:zinc-ribbon domain-containing protein [Hujiaoplasma nucleasis]|uniref:Zinc-ribbon domain-containing protein n=1 Tax=Hujiaoplasma nucleasis TaxID=2725268 RepID=A0A7L6N3P5_9MOLU|nr:zinc-ribbon domain-containing protein [Hujiaoplasma nucleasis]QLY40870.1 zinc-ribbon domain-containing protein [Hujiaoplasma nucleasis]